jgi:hypothetical protein
MPPTVDKAGLRTVPLDEPEGWHLNYAANWATLAAFNAIGGLCVTARDLDPVTMTPISRYYNVGSGYMRTSAGLLFVAGFVGQLAPASTAVNVWLDAAGALYQGPAFPTTYAYRPLAQITCDAAKITGIIDYRNPMVAIGGPISVSRVAVAANYAQGVGVNYIRADATAGPITITLGAPADYTNQLIYIRKKDNSANTVTVASAALIDGAASFALAAQGTAIVTSTGTTYERVL